MTIERCSLDVELLGLPIEERARLAELLLASLHDNEESHDGHTMDPAWMDELKRRRKEITSGEAVTYSAEDVMSQIRARLRQ